MSYNTTTTVGVSAIDLLLLAFIVLKLCGVITWSWWVVLLPLWVSLVVGIGCVIAGIAIYKKG